MLDFLLTATDLNGKRDTHRVQARNSQEAYQQLESQGFTDIVLHTDDVVATVLMKPLDEKTITPKDFVKLRWMSRFQARWYFFRKFARQAWWSLLIIALLIWQLGNRVTVWHFVLLAVLMTALFPVLKYLFFPKSNSADQFDRMMDSYYWGRWEDVLNRVDHLRGKVADFELDVCKAGALAGLGKLHEGLTILDRWEDSPDVPHWMYLARKFDSYTAAGMPDDALRCVAQAYEEAPDNPTVMLDYSMALSREERQIELAGQLVQSAERMHLSDMVAKILLPMAKGLWLTNIGSSHAAIEEFERLRENLQPMAKASPVYPLLLDMNQAYLAVALLQLGDRERAAREAKPALPRLRAFKQTRLLEKLAAVAD